MIKQLESYFSEKTKANVMLKAFSLSRVPLIFATGASVDSIDDHSCRIKIPFTKIVKNHWGSLYFGALAIGADACVGLLAEYKIRKSGHNISLVFKSFESQFLKRAEGKTFFICDAGDLIDELIQECIETGERHHRKIAARAETSGEIVAEFSLELSLKLKS